MFLTDEQRAKYKVICRSACERYCKQNHSKTSIIISIKSSWDNVMPDVFCDEKNKVKAILSLSFDDVEKVADFINKWYNKADMIIVHCDGGVSRSAGVCAAIMRVKEGDDWPIFDNRNKHPNMTCYLRTLKGFKYI